MTETHLFLQALRQEPHQGVPVWFMRQAGRYLPGYQRVRSQVDFLTLCRTPDLAAEVTLEPVELFDVDASIIFSDILVPLEAMGLNVQFTDKGPCMEDPVRDRAGIDRLVVPDPEQEIGYVMDVVRAVKKGLAGRVPVIGFAGAPFTLACYALEGSPSRTFATTLALAHQSPQDFHVLLQKLADTVIAYLKAQVAAGAQAIQLFDTWGGMLDHESFHEFSLRYCQQIMAGLEGCGVPRILFIKGAGLHLDAVANSGAEALGFDYTIEPQHARDVVAGRTALQGNLPPHALLGDEDRLRQRVRRLLATMGDLPGYVFNLGHGILPPTPIPNVKAVVEEIRNFSSTSGSS